MGERADEVMGRDPRSPDAWQPAPSSSSADDDLDVRGPRVVIHDDEDEVKVKSVGNERNEDSDSTEQIRDDMEQTRAEMSETIDAIQERLSPQNLVENAKDSVRDATIGRAEQMVSDVTDTARDASSSFMDTIRENPLPSALAGLGLGWLFMNRRSGSSSRQYGRGRYPSRGYYRDPYGYRGYARSSGESGGMGEAMDRAQERAGDFADEARERASQMASNAGEMAGDMGDAARGAGSSFWRTVQENPLPAAATAVGIAWLMANREPGTSGRSSSSRPSYRSYRQYGGYADASPLGRTAYDGGEEGGSVQEKMGEARERVAEMGSEARDRVENVGSQVREQVSDLGDTVQYRAGRAQDQFEELMENSPLAVGAIALGLGAAVGLAVPSTRQENEWMGEARDSFMDRAQEVVQDTQEKVQRIAEQAQDAAKDEAKKQDLTQ